MSDLSILRSFVAVYRTGSITRAAQHLNVAQPTVTSHLQALESSLGRPLFDRLPRGVRPRSAADELASAVAHHIDALDSVLYDDIVGRHGRGGVLYLGGPSEFLGGTVLPALSGLVARGLRVRASVGTNEPIVEQLLAGELDLAVLTELVDDPAIEAERLHQEEYVLVGAPARVKRLRGLRPGPAAAERLLDEPMIVYAESLPLVREYWRAVFDTRWQGSPAVVVNSLPVVASLAEMDLGLAVLPRHMCTPQLDAGTLRLVLRPDIAPANTLYLAWRAGSLSNPTLQVAHDLIRGAAARA